MSIEVRIEGRGRVKDGEPHEDTGIQAKCDLCGDATDVVVSVSPTADRFACKACLRGRLEATTVAQWLLRDPREQGLPWGKFSG